MGKIVEAISKMPLDEYVEKEFYQPLGLTNIGFKSIEHFPLDKIAPTENEKEFRRQLIRGYVHDPCAAMMGGVAGHAGLFSNANDLAILMQLLLNGGTFNGKQYLKKETVDLFTSYQSKISRRGYGFDKPEKNNAASADPYPCKSASPLSFGHSGFTGIFVWADPKYNLIYIFLSNRITPDESNEKLIILNARTKILEAIYLSVNKK